LEDKIKSLLPNGISIVSQGEIVAKSLADYLIRHPEMDSRCTKNASIQYFTTESIEKFSSSASIFLNEDINARHLDLG
jgi:glutamate racemase